MVIGLRGGKEGKEGTYLVLESMQLATATRGQGGGEKKRGHCPLSARDVEKKRRGGGKRLAGLAQRVGRWGGREE